MRRPATLIGLLIVLSGCAGNGGPSPATGIGDPQAPQEATASADRGAIRGTLLDDQINPLPNATVDLETADAQATLLASSRTDAAGAFAFSFLQPGAYRLRANVTGYGVATALAQVAAGEVSSLRLVLTEQASATPYVELRVFNGLTGCDSWGAVVTFFVLGGLCPTQATAKPGYDRSFPDTWRYLVFEATWGAPDEVLGFLVSPSTFTCDQEPCYGVRVGTPSLRLEGEPGKKMQNDSGFYNAPTGSIAPYPEGAFNTSIGLYYGGQLGRETTAAMKPTGYCPDACYGVASTLERRFSVYESTFHFARPPAPHQYSALPDQ